MTTLVRCVVLECSREECGIVDWSIAWHRFVLSAPEHPDDGQEYQCYDAERSNHEAQNQFATEDLATCLRRHDPSALHVRFDLGDGPESAMLTSNSHTYAIHRHDNHNAGCPRDVLVQTVHEQREIRVLLVVVGVATESDSAYGRDADA